MELRECVEADGHARLLVIIEAGDALCAKLLGRELRELGEVSCCAVPGPGWRLTLLIEAAAAFDACLIQVQEELAAVNRGRSSLQAEVIETRLVAAQAPSPAAAAVITLGSFTLVPAAAGTLQPREIPFEGGRAFGSGSHPSTRLAARLLEEEAGRQLPATVLDVGCGSGVLSLIAAKLGVRRTVGLDICHESLDVARRNVARNRLGSWITISNTPVQEISGRFDLIVANLTLSVLYVLLAHLGRLCREGGALIVSGLQGRQADDLLLRLAEAGWQFEEHLSAGKWRAMRLRRLCPATDKGEQP